MYAIYEVIEEWNIYGYVRVSSVDRNEERQLVEMKKARIFEENIWGRNKMEINEACDECNMSRVTFY